MPEALFHGLGAREEGLANHPGTAGTRQQSCVTVDVREDDAVRHRKGLAGLARQGARHERGPNRQGRLRAGQAERLVVVEADPDHRQQVRREADEPGISKVVRRSRLAGRVEGEPGRARPCTRALVHHATQHVGDEIGRIGPRRSPSVRPGRRGHRPAADGHLADGAQRHDVATVGEHRVRLRDVERRSLEDTEGNRRVRLRCRAGADVSPERGDVVVARQFRDLHGGDVAGAGEGAAPCHRPVVLVAVVARVPRLVPVDERRRRVDDHAGGGQIRAPFGNGPLEGRQVHERFEHGTRLAARIHRPVELRLRVGSPAHEREDVARSRINGNQGRFRPTARVTPDQEAIHVLEARAHGLLGKALKVEIEGRVDVDRLARGTDRWVVLRQALGNEVDKVRRLLVERASHRDEGLP